MKNYLAILVLFLTLGSSLLGDEHFVRVSTIIIRGNLDEPEGLSLNKGEVHFVGLEIPGTTISRRRFKSDLESRFLNRDLVMDDLTDLKCQILLYYKKEGCPLVEVMIPPQEVTEEVLHVIVSESHLGEVHIKGNNWSSARFTERTLDLKKGDRIRTDQILVDLSYLNRNPFKRTDVIFSAGKEAGTTDIDIITKERRPYRVYAGVDNRGNEAIGNYRQYEGFNCGHFLGMDHLFSYQLTTSLPIGRMHAHAFYYSIPLPKTMSFDFYGGYSKIHSKTFSRFFRNSGENVQLSPRYRFPLFVALEGSHDFALGFDYKRSNNNLLFSEQPITAKMATLTQLVLTYQYQGLFGWEWGTFDAEFYLSPIRMFTHQNKGDYSLLSPKAIPQYWYFILGWQKTFALPHCMNIDIRLKGQYANQNLLPSEQLGLGGFDTVRGYREREVNGELGILANLEFRSPYFSLMKFRSLCQSNTSCDCSDTIKDALRFLAFIDYGFAERKHFVKGEKNAQYLIGVGPGLQYVIDPYLNLTLYWGFRLQ
ncbi:MAG: ShlB/FhaC/HecB family hemolysin secretion/activation protein, partial [Chlamydiia bacterium]|nr:ShlB/FhaC/HecB family hemolysin secretion/activation protein [Chlamydiia bacterium]